MFFHMHPQCAFTRTNIVTKAAGNCYLVFIKMMGFNVSPYVCSFIRFIITF